MRYTYNRKTTAVYLELAEPVMLDAPTSSSTSLASAAGDGHPRRWTVLAVLCLSLLIVVVDNTILNTALPTVARGLHADTGALQWIVDAYTLTFAALLVIGGALGDRFGRRGALLVGLVVFGAGSALAANATSTGTLIGFRGLMGVGAALVMPATLSILTAVFPERERATAIGIWSAMAGIGIVVGPTLGGFLLTHFSWGSVFWVNVPLVVLAVGLVAVVVPGLAGRRASGERLDLVGAGLSAVGMLAVVDAVISPPSRGWTSFRTLGELGIGLGALAAFALWELRVSSPLIDVRVFQHRAFSAATGSLALTFLALFGSLFALTQYLQMVLGYSPLRAGLGALPFAGAVLVISPLTPILAARLGSRVVIPAGLALMGAGLLLASRAEVSTTYGYLALCVAVMGAGMGLVVATAGESIMTVLPAEQAGVGSAVNDTMQELGGSLGVAVIGSIVAAAYTNGVADGGLPTALAAPASSSLQAAQATAAAAGPLGAQVQQVAAEAFTSAMTTGFTVAAIVALAGAVLGAIYLPARARRPVVIVPEPEALPLAA